MKTIEIRVSPTGETTLQTQGYQGGECLQASRWLEAALGDVTVEQKTGEFYQSQTQTQEVRQ